MAEGKGTTEPSRVDKLIHLLANQEKLSNQETLSNLEIAEVLWLSLRIEPKPAERPAALVKQPPAPPVEPDISSGADREQDETPPVQPPSPPRAELSVSAPEVGVLPAKALPVWIADPSLLKDPLVVMRALKPLLMQVDAGLSNRLNERATVDGIARTQLWLPVMESNTEPWFDLVLVVDGSASMQLWQRLADDLARTLRCYGAFRDLQVFELGVTGEGASATVQLSTHPDRPGHRPSELIDQHGRRIAIILSDCTATYWWDGGLLPMLRDWAAVMPTVVWQMLPAWMWGRTALGRGTAVALSNGMPGAINQQLEVLPVGAGELSAKARAQSRIPVVTSEPDDLYNWSLMLAGDRRELTPGYLLPQFGGSVPKAKALEVMALEQLSADQQDDSAALEAQITRIAQSRIERFLQLSSPSAQRLVMLLAAAPVITLPVMRLIRDAMMGSGRPDERSPLPVAEVFLSGLLQKLPAQEIAAGDVEGQGLEDQTAADLVQYDFVPKVRELLLELLPAVDTVAVVNSVSAAVEARWNQFTDRSFRAFLRNPEEDAPEGLAGVRAFASVTAEILASLENEAYRAFIDELRQGAKGRDSADSPGEPLEPDFEIPPLKTLEFYRAEVREEAPPVQLVMDEFTIATVEVESEITAEERLADIVAIEDGAARAAALIELAPQLEGEAFSLLVRVMTVVQAIENKQDRLDVLSAMLPHLPDRLQGQVLELIGELEEPEGPELSVFEFEVASLVPLKGGWEVYHEPQSAYQFVEALGEDASLEMVVIPAGTFMMGSPESELERYDDESPQHEVTVETFCMGRYPITQAQWRFVAELERVNIALEADDPSRFKGDDRPVEQVTWYEAVEFCNRLSQYTGTKYQLPSEAQWEYACRAGTQSPFYFGDTISSELANYRGATVYNGGPKGEYREETTSVDYFDAANAFGLCDMHGNVWEWCADHWHDNYEGAPVDGSAWITENEDANRVSRGGSWGHDPRLCRSASRSIGRPGNRDSFTGFRVCCLAPRTLQPPAG